MAKTAQCIANIQHPRQVPSLRRSQTALKQHFPHLTRHGFLDNPGTDLDRPHKAALMMQHIQSRNDTRHRGGGNALHPATSNCPSHLTECMASAYTVSQSQAAIRHASWKCLAGKPRGLSRRFQTGDWPRSKAMDFGGTARHIFKLSMEST